ncbi:MAG: prolipoprotein diacylglyceryl transferase family protein, partial [Egibacteraceae bacterium]
GDLAIGDHLGTPAPGMPLAWQCTGNVWVRASNSFGFVPPQPYPGAALPVQGCYDVPVIQTALLDVLAAVITLVVMLAVERRVRGRVTGVVAAGFVLVYGTGRLAFDFLRGDPRYLGLTASQWTAAAVMAAIVIWLVRRRPARQGGGEPPRSGRTGDREPQTTEERG